MDPIGNVTKLLLIGGLLLSTWLLRRVSARLYRARHQQQKHADLAEVITAAVSSELPPLPTFDEEDVGEVKIAALAPPIIELASLAARSSTLNLIRAGATAKPPTIARARIPAPPYGHEVRPQLGTWDIRALPNESSASLKRTFDALPFDTALSLLRNLQEPARRNVLRRLPVMPAIKRRLEKALEG